MNSQPKGRRIGQQPAVDHLMYELVKPVIKAKSLEDLSRAQARRDEYALDMSQSAVFAEIMAGARSVLVRLAGTP